MMLNSCRCGSGLTYASCCEPFHLGEKYPPTAEALMRSRFVAFCLQNTSYLLATWDSHSRPAILDFANDTTEWLQLEIISTKKGGIRDNKGRVTFKAYYRQHGKVSVLSEVSRFQKIGQCWFYRDGIVYIDNELMQ